MFLLNIKVFRFLFGPTGFVRSFFGNPTNLQNCPVPNFSTMSGESSCAHPPGTFSIAFVTVPDEPVAKKIAHGLVSSKLAACVNIIPQITSVYEWKGQIQEDSEFLLKIKTRTAKIQEITEFVKKNHPYEVCEVIATPITDGNKDYLNWLADIVKP